MPGLARTSLRKMVRDLAISEPWPTSTPNTRDGEPVIKVNCRWHSTVMATETVDPEPIRRTHLRWFLL